MYIFLRLKRRRDDREKLTFLSSISLWDAIVDGPDKLTLFFFSIFVRCK